ncbi:hypothetical protein F7R91_38255 [Streptomyces luteolifulvus]|uniref:Uncharacterized protein n=1 Tax=Streptomyces luteolifulvus TaxID=2615112 RepID=A0A6H9UNT2_9ACTN|nr:hypothetical protein F7R91_38255 [Streptomyces luteolifulvus]
MRQFERLKVVRERGGDGPRIGETGRKPARERHCRRCGAKTRPRENLRRLRHPWASSSAIPVPQSSMAVQSR